jgi:hypothetical protein
MDEFLERACSRASKSFDGFTLFPKDLLPLTELASALAATVDFLQTKFPAAELLRHADWHEHDGFITSSAASSWAEVSMIVASPDSLYASRVGEDFVRLGIYERTGSFYLRIWVPDEDDDPEQYPGRWGSFDLSSSHNLVNQVASSLTIPGLETSEAKSYFEARSAA